MDREVGAAALLLVGQADADEALGDRVEDQAGDEGVGGEGDRAEELGQEARRRPCRRAASEPEDAAGDAAPEAAEAVERPDAEDVVDLQLLLRPGEADDEDAAGGAADDERADRVEDVGAGADRDEAGEGAVVDEAGVGLRRSARRRGCRRPSPSAS